MHAKKHYILLFACLNILVLIGYRASEGYKDKCVSINNEQPDIDYNKESESTKSISENITIIPPDQNDKVSNIEDRNDKSVSTYSDEAPIDIYGKWNMEKVVLKSDAYDGTSKEALGGIDEEDYVGLELEFTDKFFRLDEKKYPNPEYSYKYWTVEEYNEGGKYKLPSTYEFILNEKIQIANSEKYESLSEVPIKFYQIDFNEDYIIPVGTQVVLLNNDTMLVGIWGKIILARRIK